MFWPPCPAAVQAADPKGERLRHPSSPPGWPVPIQGHPRILTFVFPPLLLPPQLLVPVRTELFPEWPLLRSAAEWKRRATWSGLPRRSCSRPTRADPTVLLPRQGHEEPLQAFPHTERSEKPLYRNLTAEKTNANFLAYHDLGPSHLPLTGPLRTSF